VSRGFIDGEYEDGEIRGLLLAVGRRGCGKTTLVKRKLEVCTGGVLFFDTLSKHAAVFPGYVVFTAPGPLLEYLRVNRGRRFRVLYQPRAGDLDKHFKAVCRIVRAFGWMIFAIDEIDALNGPNHGPKWMPKELYALVNYGRHAPVSMIATARRPQDVARGFRAESDWFVFCLQDEAAIASLANRIGDKNLETVRNLPKFSYLHCVQDEEPVICGGRAVYA
jgi:hypothetical protein